MEEPQEETYAEHLEKWREGRGCSRKKWRFQTRGEAKKKAKHLTQKLRNGRMNAYKCEFCGYFHIGHNWTSQASLRKKLAKAEANS